MSKKTRLVAFFVVALLGVIACNPECRTYAYELESVYGMENNEGQVWFEDGEISWVPGGEAYCVTDDPLLRENYTSYQFSKNTNIKTNYNGKVVTLFTHTIYGTVYFYTDGKVHLYSLGSSVSNIHPDYSAKIKSNTIANTDGTVSVGTSEVETSSSVYPTSTIYVTVTFNYGSAQAEYHVFEY